MRIDLDKVNKLLVLKKNDDSVVSSYSYKNSIDDDFTEESLENDIKGFNKTLGTFPEFDNIKELGKIINLHNF